MTMLIRELPCYACRHWQGKNTCTAFPQGIPQTILDGDNQHRQPVEGDNGIRFERRDGRSEKIINENPSS